MPQSLSKLWLWLLGVGCVLLTLLFLLPQKYRSRVFLLFLCVLFVVTALFSTEKRLLGPTSALEEYIGQNETVMLSVKEVRYQYDYASAYLVEVNKLATYPHTTSALLRFEFNPEFEVGDVLAGTVCIERINAYSSTPAYYLADGITLYLEPTEDGLFVMDHHETESVLPQLRELNRYLSQALTDGLGGKEGNLVSSLLLGNKELLSGSVLRDFRRAGIIHALAISGMHLALMVALAEFLLKRFRVHKTIRCLLVLTVALFYLALTGFAISTVRAFIMTSFVYLAYLLGGDNDSITSLFFALFIILLVSPNAIYDVGMWLSFSATFGILIANEFLRPLKSAMYERFKSKRLCKWTYNILAALVISFAASFAIFLPAWLFFDEISLLSIPATVLLSPVITLVLYLSPFYLLFANTAILSTALALCLKIGCRILLWGTSLFSSLPHATVSLNYPFEAYLIPISSVIIGILLLIPLRKRWPIPLATLMATAAFFICLGVHQTQHNDSLSVQYLQNGESEMLLAASTDTLVICDLSNGSYQNSYQALLHSKEFYATEIDAYVLTHYHNAHAITLRRLNEQVMIRNLLIPFPENEKEYYVMCALLETAQACHIPVTVYDRGKALPNMQGFTLFISEEIYLKRSEHPTCYVAVQATHDLFLYLGESSHESAQLAKQIESLIPRADTVILGTHGPIIKAPIPYALENVPTLVIANTNLLPYLPVVTQPTGKWLVENHVVTVTLKK